MDVREPIAVYGKKKFTEQEYLDFERNSLEKHEYYRGEIFTLAGRRDFDSMAGAGRRHIIISKNLMRDIANALRGKPCQPYGSDLRINIPENTLYTYPDLSIICGDILTSSLDEETATCPTVIIEILSPSTRAYDQGEKFALYRAIPTLKEYILVDPDTVLVQAFRMNEARNWLLEECKSLPETLFLPSVNISLCLRDIYEGTKLDT
jgi:Uma2 family endonuclease